MKQLLNLLVSATFLFLTSCSNNDKLQDVEESIQSGSFIEAYYIEPYEVNSASIQEVKNYMQLIAPELYMHDMILPSQGSYINYSLEYTFVPQGVTSSEMKYFGSYMYNFVGKDMSCMELESVLCLLPTFQMCYDGLSKKHTIRETTSTGEHKNIIFNLREGVGQVILSENTESFNQKVGLFCVQLGR